MSKNIKVAVRCRPLIDKEQLEGQACDLVCSPGRKQVVADEKHYSFDYVFNAGATQEDIFLNTVSPLVTSFIKGENVAVMAYGQTGSGKTFTMGTGPYHGSISVDSDDIGIVPRVLRHIFENASQTTDPDIHTEIKVSFLEIYNEDVYDILNPNRPRVQIRQQDTNVKLTDLTEFVVHSYDEGMKYLHDGASIRTTGATATSAHSSRSHAIFYVSLSRASRTTERVQRNTFLLVDLAGSESVKKTLAQGTRFQEGININKSLLALSKVIRAMSQDKVKYHAPYRDSTLTRLLQGCLQENCNALVIACISPIEDSMAETNNTLQFATCAQNVKRKDPYPWSSKKRTPQWYSTPKVNSHATTSGSGINTNEPVLPTPINQRLMFSPMSVVEERLEETFKKPGPKRDGHQSAYSFTPYANRICSRLEKCIDKLADTKSVPVMPLDTPACKRLVETITHRTIQVLKESANLRFSETSCKESYDSLQGECNDTVIRKREMDASICSLPKRSRFSTLSRTNCWETENQSNVENSILLSSNRNRGEHTDIILKLLNNGSLQQLQLLPSIGPKSAVIIHNWISQTGPLRKISDLKDIPGLSKGFVRKFVANNSLVVESAIF